MFPPLFSLPCSTHLTLTLLYGVLELFLVKFFFRPLLQLRVRGLDGQLFNIDLNLDVIVSRRLPLLFYIFRLIPILNACQVSLSISSLPF